MGGVTKKRGQQEWMSDGHAFDDDRRDTFMTRSPVLVRFDH